MTGSDDQLTDPARRSQLDRLLVRVAAHAPIRTAIVHPCDAVSLRGATEAARMRLIVPVLIVPVLIGPVLIGPAAKTAAAAAPDPAPCGTCQWAQENVPPRVLVPLGVYPGRAMAVGS